MQISPPCNNPMIKRMAAFPNASPPKESPSTVESFGASFRTLPAFGPGLLPDFGASKKASLSPAAKAGIQTLLGNHAQYEGKFVTLDLQDSSLADDGHQLPSLPEGREERIFVPALFVSQGLPAQNRMVATVRYSGPTDRSIVKMVITGNGRVRSGFIAQGQTMVPDKDAEKKAAESLMNEGRFEMGVIVIGDRTIACRMQEIKPTSIASAEAVSFLEWGIYQELQQKRLGS